MTTFKMIFAVVGSLIFLGLFSAGFSSAQNQEMPSMVCESKTNTQEISLISLTCITTSNNQSIGKG
ncbi:MAG: hypothetical protein HRT54_20370 [Colwellia sp.]|nr:hypothetical protein [Colwellia sp.]